MSLYVCVRVMYCVVVVKGFDFINYYMLTLVDSLVIVPSSTILIYHKDVYVNQVGSVSKSVSRSIINA